MPPARPGRLGTDRPLHGPRHGPGSDDDDGDGRTDFAPDRNGDGIADSPGDPGCRDPLGVREDPQCQDGIDNDGHPGTDFDAGESILGAGAGDPAGPDPQCLARSWHDREATPRRCGLGFELAPLLAAAAVLRRRRSRAAARAGAGRRSDAGA